jgi:hypothetical protein
VSDLVPSEAAIRAFEALKQGRVEGLFAPGLLTGEQIIAGLLLRLTQQQDALYQALTGRPSPAPSPAEAVQTILAVTFSLIPGDLNAILVGTPGVAGYVAAAPVQFPTLVAAGGTATVVIPPPPGFVLGAVGPVEVSTTDVGAQVQVSATLDGKPLVGAQGFVLGPAAELRGPEASYATGDGLVVKFTNPSPSNVTVWMFGEMLTISRTFYDKFIAALENAAYQAISAAYGLKVS